MKNKANLILISAYGLKKEHVASNRIFYLSKELSAYFERTFIVNPDLPRASSFEFDFAKVVKVPLSFSGKLLRKIIELRKKRISSNVTSSDPKQKSLSRKLRLLSSAKETIRLNQLFWMAEGYPVPFRRMLFSCLRIIRSLSKDETTVAFTSSGPGCILLIGYLLKKIFKKRIFWIADYRDALEDNPYFPKSSKSLLFKFVNNCVFSYSDLITVVSRGVGDSLIKSAEERGFNINNKLSLVYNGIPELNISSEISGKNSSKQIQICYTSTLYPGRNEGMEIFLQALRDTDLNQKIKLSYAGKSSHILKNIANRVNALCYVEDHGFLKKHKCLHLQRKSDVFLIIKSPFREQGVLTGSFFEYLLHNKPILVVGDTDKEFNEIAEEFGGIYILPHDKEVIRDFLLKLASDRKIFSIKRNENALKKFLWSEIARKLAAEIEKRIPKSKEP